MAVCVFDIKFAGSAEALLERARAGLREQKGTLTGDATKGSIVVPVPGGQVTGTYAVTGSVAHFEITAKPFFVSCARIQSELTKFAAPPVAALAESRAPRQKARTKPARPPARAKTPAKTKGRRKKKNAVRR